MNKLQQDKRSRSGLDLLDDMPVDAFVLVTSDALPNADVVTSNPDLPECEVAGKGKPLSASDRFHRFRVSNPLDDKN